MVKLYTFSLPGACGERGLCYDLPDNRGYRCVCPVGLTGSRCETGGCALGWV